ncbi:MAG: hypothetical protein DMF68_04395 [Acidobacteria bacterium]|nr:MAG: hypothetical protein DMF68_04395 [Acidobacteriota bacterium]
MASDQSSQSQSEGVSEQVGTLANDSNRHATRIADIQHALRDAQLDGWLFYDFRKSDPLAYRILLLDPHAFASRRWAYYIPANGEPVRIVHRIEQEKLDELPGKTLVYLRWQQLHAHLRVVQVFEAVWTPEQKAMHDAATDNIHRIIQEAFAEIARRIRADEPTTEYDIQQFILQRFEDAGMTSDNDPPIVAVNANSASPHYGPTSTRHSLIRSGDFVLLDVWAKLKNTGAVYADQTWTGFVGETVPDEHARIFEIVSGARDAAVAFLREQIGARRSIRGAEVDDISRGVIERAGYGEQFTTRTGHSIGEEVHGNGANIDNLETPDARRIIPRTCFSIEPGIYQPNLFGVRSEIDVYVGDGEIEVTGQPIQTAIVPILQL